MKFLAVLTFLAAISTILALDLDYPYHRDLEYEESSEARYEVELSPRYDQGFSLEERGTSEVEVAPRFIQMAFMVAKQLVQQVVKAVIKAVMSLISDIKDEKKNRAIFVKNLLAGLVSKNPKFNYMIIHPKHTARWAGRDGTDWHKEHVECDTIRLLKKTIGYDIYAGQEGEVQLRGDGSFINVRHVVFHLFFLASLTSCVQWAFQGKFTRSGKQGHIVKFSKMV
ncbi:hypothetical protein C8J56DRAFT_1168542 [Mycena floridula]|nr:hypothetical protein C8J56DRAFT_1168542 [Mycena floridula]